MPTHICCGFCHSCVPGYSGACLTTNRGKAGAAYGYPGMGGCRGAQMEVVRVPFADANALRLPGDPGDEHEHHFVLHADALPTGYHTLELAGVAPGASVAICGARAIGDSGLRPQPRGGRHKRRVRHRQRRRLGRDGARGHDCRMTLGSPTNLDPLAIPAAATPDGDGILLGDGPVLVDAYVDFQCPYCRMFETDAGDTLDAMIADRAIRLAYHPLGFLDRLSTTRYSSRAAAASGCAADSGRFRPYARALFAGQPPEGGPGLSDDELVELGRTVGLTEPAFAHRVASAVHLPWVRHVTERAVARGVSGTPSIFVAGVPAPADGRAIAAAVDAALR